MKHEFRIQDPTHPDTIYLIESIAESVREAKAGMGIFAFASLQGVDALLEDDDFAAFLGRGTFDLIVGIDAVTNRPTLERLQSFDNRIPNLNVRVFWNRRSGGLFHPKITRFVRQDGSRTAIVGSGNLTPGGLWDNYEAYSVVTADPDEDLDLSEWDSFVTRHAADIQVIDEEALERAARNIIRGGRRRRDVEPDVVTTEEEPDEEPDTEEEQPDARVLVAQVPKAGDRWDQVHFNVDVAQQFFRVEPASNLRVFMTAVAPTGSLSPQEVRKVRKDVGNSNVRIELKARKGTAYPAQGVPVAVFREDQARTFRYVILMPGEPGHAEMFQLTEELEPVGRGHRRAITGL
ncbi:phospholipase D family protein [Zavarzinella formosa]|uniref:phospholipase D family protein n=1 Tax=Zavarzinella formosa TaxID=360055 RepID=UPI0002F7CA6C|nr:phospholipase D family protein [Zavarzinella formosa]